MFKMTRTIEYTAGTREDMDRMIASIFVSPGHDFRLGATGRIRSVSSTAVEEAPDPPVEVGTSEQEAEILDRRVEDTRRQC